MRIAAVLIFLGLAIALPLRCQASCTSEYKTAIDMGMRFLRDAQAYERRDEADLANADYENLGHQLELINGVDGAKACADAGLTLKYSMLTAYDVWQRYLNYSRDERLANERKQMAWVLWESVANFYQAGGYTYYPSDYIELKAAVKTAYSDSGLTYCSLEKDITKCPPPN